MFDEGILRAFNTLSYTVTLSLRERERGSECSASKLCYRVIGRIIVFHRACLEPLLEFELNYTQRSTSLDKLTELSVLEEIQWMHLEKEQSKQDYQC